MMRADDEMSLVSVSLASTATRRRPTPRPTPATTSSTTSSTNTLQSIIDNILDLNLRTICFSKKGRLISALLCFVFFTSSKISSNLRTIYDDRALMPISQQPFTDRSHCQIVYVLGVEGSIHHGFTPILETLAKQQKDPTTGKKYTVSYPSGRLRRSLFGMHGEERALDDKMMIRHTFRKICPLDGKKHVIIEDASLPCGHGEGVEDGKGTKSFRGFARQDWWAKSDMYTIAKDNSAVNHPTNFYKFLDTYSPYAEIKFVVIHRSFLETIASHTDFDGNIQHHSTVIRGFMLLIRTFLDSHPIDKISGKPLWTVVCMERLMAKFYNGDDRRRAKSRQQILKYLTNFLGWPTENCPTCWDSWKDSSKVHKDLLGKHRTAILNEHMETLQGIWPPLINNSVEEQKCNL